MDGHLRGGGSGWKLVRAERLQGDVYRVVLEHPGRGRVEALVRLRDGVLETPFGSFHISQLRIEAGTGSVAPGDEGSEWLVERRGGELHARLAVRVVEALKKPGEEVDEGEVLLLVETMKMVNEVAAPCRGVVEELAEPGRGVQPGGLLARLRCL